MSPFENTRIFSPDSDTFRYFQERNLLDGLANKLIDPVLSFLHKKVLPRAWKMKYKTLIKSIFPDVVQTLTGAPIPKIPVFNTAPVSGIPGIVIENATVPCVVWARPFESVGNLELWWPGILIPQKYLDNWCTISRKSGRKYFDRPGPYEAVVVYLECPSKY